MIRAAGYRPWISRKRPCRTNPQGYYCINWSWASPPVYPLIGKSIKGDADGQSWKSKGQGPQGNTPGVAMMPRQRPGKHCWRPKPNKRDRPIKSAARRISAWAILYTSRVRAGRPIDQALNLTSKRPARLKYWTRWDIRTGYNSHRTLKSTMCYTPTA